MIERLHFFLSQDEGSGRLEHALQGQLPQVFIRIREKANGRTGRRRQESAFSAIRFPSFKACRINELHSQEKRCGGQIFPSIWTRVSGGSSIRVENGP